MTKIVSCPLSRVTCLFVIITFTFTTLFEGGALAMPVPSGQAASGNQSGQLGQIAESAGAVQSFQADLFTGRAQTSVPIFVPPGRKNVQPNLALSYSSSGGNGWLGNSWGLDLGFIQRDVKKGVPKYDSTDTYVFSYQGVNSELISVATNEYRAKDEALFLKFFYNTGTNSWTVTDKSGTKHTFGGTTDSRQTNALGTFKWALSEVKDMSTNYMSVTYTSDNGEIYLSTIDYNGNSGQSFAHTHKVEFTLEDRNDDAFSYITGAKVSTIKRLQKIEVKVNVSGTYQLARKYSITYEYSPSSNKSRLKTVTECGTDGTTCLPATTFTYQDKPLQFESMTNVTGITSGTNTMISKWQTTNKEQIVDLVDLDGDGFLDRITASSGNTNWQMQKGNGSSFATAANFGPINRWNSDARHDWIRYRSDNLESFTELLDVNGDGLADRVLAAEANTVWKVQLNQSTGFDSSFTDYGTISRWNNDARHDWPRYVTSNGETLTDFQDINGDGLPDRILAKSGETKFQVQLNTGSGFASLTDFTNVLKYNSDARTEWIRYTSTNKEQLVDLTDVNGDGLPDRVIALETSGPWKVQYNKGSSFTNYEDFSPIEKLNSESDRYVVRLSGTSEEQKVDFFDIDGDGYQDRVESENNNTVWKVQYHRGTGFTSLTNFSNIEKMGTDAYFSHPRLSNASGELFVDMADLDGDGLMDRIQAEASNTTWKMQKNKGPYPDLLKEIGNGRGGKTLITYSPSTIYDNTDISSKERLPFPIQVVSQVDQLDGVGNTYTTTYSYKGGMYDSMEREFRGFREVTVTDAVSTQTIHTFDQSTCKKGKLLQKEVWGFVSGVLSRFSKEVTTWDETHPYTGVHFAFVSQQDNYLYDGDETYKQTRQTFTYDSYGNLASTTEEGDTSLGTDSRKTVNTYVYNTTDYILNTLSKTTLYDTDLTTIKAERYFYYDGASSITTSPTDGLLTKEEEWLNTASGCGAAGTCANNPKTTMTYDSYSNVATVTDARSYMTTNTYDSTYHLFLIEIENAAEHTREFTYDPKLAQILTSTDQNSQVTETQYDVLGRVTKVIVPLDSSAKPTQEFAYEYPNLGTCGSTCVTKTTTKVKSSIGDDTLAQLITYSFTDGLGREIQRRSPAEDSGDQIVSGIVIFNSRGLVYQQYVAYFEDTSSSYQVSVTNGPKATFTYDAIGRRIRIDYPDGTNSQVAFSDFVKTTTDQRGKQLRYTNDAYGRLITVEEFNSGSTYTTTYEYDVLNNLKKTTDNASNETTITYDSLSRKTGMVDLDMGTWSYAYDLNDNLTSQTDAKSQTISFTYDDLNRVTLKDLPSGETDVDYDYDSAPSGYSGQTGYWVGRLAKVTDVSGTHEFIYDKQGRVLKDKKTVDAAAYEFVRTYDSMGRVRTLTYPDTEVVTYTYNGFGDVETIAGVKDSVTTHYIKDVDYNPSGQITFTKYGNDVTSDYTYDANTLRLENILTKKPDGTTKLQDLSYVFDNNGNVTAIDDIVNSMSQDFTYDDLNRLTQAIGSAYGTQNFVYDSIGNMTTKGSRTMSYGAGSAGPHAVTEVTWTGSNYPTFCRDFASGSCSLGYDSNGNMTTRGQDVLAYDSENRLKEMKLREGESGSTNYTLKPGWNVISFTHLPDDRSVSSVLSSLTFNTDYDQVSTWDEATDTWKHWVNDSDFNDFTSFEYGKTYEIYNKAGVDKSFSVTGKTVGSDISHSIVSGDNFISPAVKTATNIATVLSTLTQGTHYDHVERFNASTQTWESSPASFTQFEPGKGYIIVGLTNAAFSYGKNETTTTFIYDSTGSRVKKVVGATTTTYLGKDYEKEGSVTSKHIFLGDRRVTTKKSDGTKQYIHSDHINSSNVITDASGNQSGMLEYDPYGSTVTSTGTALKHKFTGQEEDSSTKLYYYGHRYYDPQLGRFIAPDPFVQDMRIPQAFNRYSYALNNPLRYTDPTGFFWEFIVAVIVAAVKAAAVGAAVGAVIGALDAAFRGEKILRGAAGGAIAGAIGGAIGGPVGHVVSKLSAALQAAQRPVLARLVTVSFRAAKLGLKGIHLARSIEDKRWASVAFSGFGAISDIAEIHGDIIEIQEGRRTGWWPEQNLEEIPAKENGGKKGFFRPKANGKPLPNEYGPGELGDSRDRPGIDLIAEQGDHKFNSRIVRLHFDEKLIGHFDGNFAASPLLVPLIVHGADFLQSKIQTGRSIDEQESWMMQAIQADSFTKKQKKEE
ncbi:MAG: VCBS repeat-containing protein [Candidatus Omnitrophica bacterium]|nr:VCBS repeat-containing protein [Candidatus Omnitrophota bacterium]